MRRRAISAFLVGLALSAPCALQGQVKDTARVIDSAAVARGAPPGTADTANRALLTRNDLLFTAALAAGTVLVAQLDAPVAEHLQDTANPATKFTKNVANVFNLYGFPGTFVITGAMYLAGIVDHHRGLADAGLHIGEALVLAEATTYVLKFSFGRARPSYAGTDNPGDFKFGRGLKGDQYASFPSGHASAAFAFAAAGTSEVADRWPHATIYVAPVLYGSAALVAWARLESNHHWLSDVFFGAGVGTLLGIKTVRYNHKHPHNVIDRLFLPRLPAVAPVAGGVRLMWTFRPKFLEAPLPN